MIKLKEAWKPVGGYEELYMVSNHGRVKSMDRKTVHKNGRVHFYASRVLIPACFPYPQVRLWKNGKGKNFNIHNLVCLSFIGNKPKGLTVNHKDAVKTNNRIDNLEYVTYSDNTKHAQSLGLHHSRKGISKFIDTKCLVCSDIFRPVRDTNVFCSKSCANKWRKYAN